MAAYVEGGALSAAVGSAMSSGVRVGVLRTLPEIEKIRGQWESWPGNRDSDIDVFLTVCRSSPNVLRPHVLVLFRNGRPSSMLVGRIVDGRFPLKVGYFNLFKPQARAILFSYGGLRGDACPESCAALTREIIKSLVAGEADFALLDHVDIESDLFRYVRHLPGFFFRDHLPSVQHRWIMDLPGSVEALYEHLSYNQRSHFRKTVRRLQRSFPGQVRLRCLHRAADLDAILWDVEEIAKKTYQRRLGVGFNNNPVQTAFLRFEAEMGWLRTYLVYLGDKPCAYWIGAVYQQRFCSDFTGYDPDYTHHAVGTYILSQMLEELCGEGVRAVDFGWTDSAYKERICNIMKREATLYMFAPTPKGISLSAMRALTSIVHEPLRTLLERMNLIQNAKRVWRKVARGKGQPGAG
jgi:hypothetical protein